MFKILMAFAAVAVVALALSGCGGTDADAAHPVLAEHPDQPKRLEAVIEIDMNDTYFANPQGEKNPTFTLPAGKTVGIHLHNDGKAGHEVVIGRDPLDGGDYSETLTKLVPADVFFYYGEEKAEVGGAMFGEVEVEPGIRDVWIRMEIPADMAGQEWELGCFVEGHYEAGMHTVLVFE